MAAPETRRMGRHLSGTVVYSALCECVTTAMIGTFRNTLSAPKNFTCFHLAASKQVPDLDDGHVVAILVSLEIHSIEKSA